MDRININGVEYYRLYCKCPVCVERGYDSEPVYWQHQECEGDMYIGDDATLFCERDATVIPVTQAEFLCPNHRASKGFLVRHGYTTTPNFPIILDELVHSVGLEWINRFVKNLIQEENI